MREPNLKCFSVEEEDNLTQQALLLYEQGREDEADALLDSLPVPAEYLQVLKESEGVSALIEEGFNLSKAVEKYGQSWLTS